MFRIIFLIDGFFFSEAQLSFRSCLLFPCQHFLPASSGEVKLNPRDCSMKIQTTVHPAQFLTPALICTFNLK